MRIVGLFFVLLLLFVNGRAQETQKDSVQNSKTEPVDLLNDSTGRGKKRKVVTIETYAKRFDPRKALFYSAVLPGLGQAYNKKYWKIPLVYGGFLGLLAVVKYYDDLQFKYKNQLFDIINYPDIPVYTTISNPEIEKQLRAAVDQARRQRDYFMIFTGFFYILQMVDAHVDAHLKEFELNPKLHVRLEPTFNPAQGLGLGLTLKF
ncbi:MAG TPA: DUF5683 domain-containing protein [Cyclobacteriaceae bacterium]|jgi:hypothetical protein|nr:DUF5683 domain-containing protein [Cyclobacteriaceae bacterium]